MITRFLAMFGAIFMFAATVSVLYNVCGFAQTAYTSIFGTFILGYVLTLPLVIELYLEYRKGE